MPDPVLLVEDDEVNRRLVEYLLNKAGFEPVVAEDGRKASEIITTQPPVRLAVLDVRLPYLDGFQLLDLIRNNAQWRRVPVVMLSGQSKEADVVRALEAGANDYVTKPFQPKELIARIRRLIKGMDDA